jgi:hypothetical protein
MALRESGRASNKEYNLEAIVKPSLEIGVDGGAELLVFADAILGTDRGALDKAREALAAKLGATAVAAASIIAANFTKNDRIANGLGIPSEPPMLEATMEFRESFGINAYPSAVNSLG